MSITDRMSRVFAHPRTRRALRWLRRAVIAGAVLAAVAVLTTAGALRAEYAGHPAAAGRTRGRDALWLGHAWLDGRHTPADLARLARQVRDTGIRDLYVHAGPLEHDGSLDPTLDPDARTFLADVHRALPEVRVQAWLGDVVAFEGHRGLHLNDPAVRDRIRGSARQILDLGFQGVHLDLEPVASGNAGYLKLLDSVHALTAGRGVPLSVATPQIDPLPALHSFVGPVTTRPKWWSQGYFAQVAHRVDEVAVMAYDTWQPAKSLFGGYVAEQTTLALEVTPDSTDLLIGLPAYHTDDIGHHASAETVAAAVRGARVALARHDRTRTAFGLALYVDFAATASDWASYRAGWGTP